MSDEERVGTASVVTVEFEALEALICTILEGAGASVEDAAVVAWALSSADARGQHSHGLLRLPVIVGRVAGGFIDPEARPVLTEIGPSVVAMDAAHGFGHAMARRAADVAADRAAATGAGIVLVRNNNHIGMLALYLERLAERGMVSLIMTTTEAFVRPHGGREPLIGTNPIGIGFPSSPPFVLDMSTSATAIGKIVDAQQRGAEIPGEWAVDTSGRPTVDPDAALAGAINPFGGIKGYGLGVAVALLAGALTGTAMGPEVAGTLDTERFANKGDVFLAIDPSRLPWADQVEPLATGFLNTLRSSATDSQGQAVLVPGDRGARAASQARSAGVEVSVGAWEAAQDLLGERTEEAR